MLLNEYKHYYKNIFCPRAQYTVAMPLLKQSWKIT